MFQNQSVNLEILQKRAFNLRWATYPKDVIPLTAADPDFPCAPEIHEAIAKYSKDRYFSYGNAEGLSEFKESLAHFFQKKRNVPVEAQFTLPVDSAAFGIYTVCKAFLSAGDEAIIFNPVDFLFRYSIETVGAKAVSFAIPQNCEALDFTYLEALIVPKTKMICLCNPLNPTGKVFTKQELETLGTLAVRHNLIILSDEIWSDIVFAPHVFTSIASINEAIRAQTITVTGFSKSYGLAGLRIGAIMAHTTVHYSKIFEASLHQSTIHGASILSQVAAMTALNDCEYWLHGFVAHLQTMRDLVVEKLNAIPNFKCSAPEGCYVAFVDIKATNSSSLELQEKILKEAKVAVVPGLKQWFGDGSDGYLRLSFATSEEILTEAMQRIQTIF